MLSPCVGSVVSQQQLSCLAVHHELLQLRVEEERSTPSRLWAGELLRAAGLEAGALQHTKKKGFNVVKRMAGRWEEWL